MLHHSRIEFTIFPIYKLSVSYNNQIQYISINETATFKQLINIHSFMLPIIHIRSRISVSEFVIIPCSLIL